MSNHPKLRLSDLMPNSWFYKLRDMKRPRPPIQQRSSTATRTSKRSSSSHYYHGSTTPRPLPPLSTHQSYSYLVQAKQSRLPEELDLFPFHLNSKARGIQVRDEDQSTKPRSATNYEFQELKLRPIRTRPMSLTESGSVHHSKTTSSTSPRSPRLKSRRLHLLSSGCRVSTTSIGRRSSTAAKRSYPVVVASTDPYKDFWESIVEMIAENNIHGSEALGDLLECYLSLNSREYHGVITEVFTGIWLQVTDGRIEL
uniref:Uncharacterized protein n=1 Tax=Avena sativa TaxID=4498 RepID=A0ACD5UHZ7_AVESA